MANARFGIVTFKGQPAGILQEEPGGGTVFTYDEGWTQDIACSLPASTRRHADRHGLLPFFAHLAPEGWLRARQSAYAHVDRDDDFGILLAYANDCIGVVGIQDPTGKISGKVHIAEEADALDWAAVGAERTISGVQAKILCRQSPDRRFYPAGKDGPAPFVAKFPSEDLTDLVANEAASLDLCSLLLGKREVVEFTQTAVMGIQKPALLVKRFDRQEGPEKEKLRCEEFAQVLARDPGVGFQGKYDAEYADLKRALAWSAAPILDARRVFLRLSAFIVLGNVDCHLKNWSLLETPAGLRLSPVYDVVNGYLYGGMGYTTRFGLKLRGERRQWEDCDRGFLFDIAEELGLPRKAAQKALQEQAAVKDKFFNRLNQPLGLSEERSRDYRNCVSAGWERIHG